MQRNAVYPIDEITLWLFERIIQWYTRYTVLRCAKYTNSRAQTEHIAVHALVTTCLLAGELTRVRQLGLLIDVMVDVVAKDTIGGVEFRRGVPADEADVLIDNERMGDLAEAFNRLDPCIRDVLVLYHLEETAHTGLAQVFATSAEEIREEIAKGETALLEHLHDVQRNESAMAQRSAGSLLNEFAAGLDPQWTAGIANAAIGYLAECANDVLKPADWNIN